MSARAKRAEVAKQAWIERQLAKAKPFNERQQMLIRTAFAAERTEQRGVA